MSSTLIAIIGLVYLYIAGEQAYKGEYPTAVMYIGYTIGNVGLFFLTNKG